MEEKYIDFYNECISVWGEDSQLKMCIEEMAELTKELVKTYRDDTGKSPEQIEKICEEIADVQNMVDQMQHVFGKERVDEIRKQKIERTKKVLEDYKRRKV